MLWNGNYEFKLRFYCLNWIIQCFLAKLCMCDTTWSLGEIGGSWEQFHDWYFPQLQVEYLPWEGFWEKPSVGYSLLRNSLWQVWGVSQKFSEKKTSFWIMFLRKKFLVICVLPLLGAKWRRPLGGSSWKLLELTRVSRFLAYVTLLYHRLCAFVLHFTSKVRIPFSIIIYWCWWCCDGYSFF